MLVETEVREEVAEEMEQVGGPVRQALWQVAVRGKLLAL